MPRIRVPCGSAVLLLVAAFVAAGCTTDPYPLHAGPPHAGQLNPAQVGSPTQAVVLFIEIRPGDRLEFMRAEPIGVGDGASVTFHFSPPILQSNGDRLTGSSLEPLEGTIADAATSSVGPDNTVGIVAELTADRPGRYTLTSVRLHYRLNGGPEQVREGIDVVWTVCADDAAPTPCA
jgi:hypothetical protein